MKRVFSLAVLLLMLSVSAFAQITPAPSLLNFQGRLARPDGTPVPDGAYSIRFSLHDAASGGTERWNKTLATVTVRNGVFAVLLDFTTGFTAGNDLTTTFNNPAFLEIKIGSDAPLTPRQQVLSVAYALRANAVADNSITSASIVNGSIAAVDLVPGTLNTLSWLLAGNSGTNPATQFVGTKDNQPLNFRVNQRRAMRFEFGTQTGISGVNIIGGNQGNRVTVSALGATIAGGGITDVNDDNPNTVSDNFGTVGGGINNQAGDLDADPTNNSSATVAGGAANTASGNGTAIGGGQTNIASGIFSTVPGGRFNTASGDTSFAAGFRAKANHDGAFVWADSQNADFASTETNQVSVRAANGLRLVSNKVVTSALGSGAFAILNSAGTAGLQFDVNEILPVGSSIFAINGSNLMETRINSTVFITTANHVGIGDSDPLYRLELPNIASDDGGRGRANRWDTYSSGRWKHNIVPIENALDKVLRLNGVMFDWLPEHGGTHDIGFVAEDAGKVVPELVSWEKDGKYANAMAYDRVTALLVEAMKSLKQENDRKDAELRAVKDELAALKALVQQLAEKQNGPRK